MGEPDEFEELFAAEFGAPPRRPVLSQPRTLADIRREAEERRARPDAASVPAGPAPPRRSSLNRPAEPRPPPRSVARQPRDRSRSPALRRRPPEPSAGLDSLELQTSRGQQVAGWLVYADEGEPQTYVGATNALGERFSHLRAPRVVLRCSGQAFAAWLGTLRCAVRC